MTRLLSLLLAGVLLVGCADSFVGAEDVGDVDRAQPDAIERANDDNGDDGEDGDTEDVGDINRTQPDRIRKAASVVGPGGNAPLNVATAAWDTPGDPNQTDTNGASTNGGDR